MTGYADAHCHLHEYSDGEAERLAARFYIAAVSEDYESSLRTLTLAERLASVWPCVGLHPWELGSIENPMAEAERIASLAPRAACIGEVGLDKKFVPETYEEQLPVYRFMVDLAAENGLPVNIHSPGAWRDAYAIAARRGVDKAVFHWYTGPLDLIREIAGSGYFISVNAAIAVQEKMRRVAAETPIEYMVVESDGPYRYRGLELSPLMIPDTVKAVAELKGMEVEEAAEVLLRNTFRLYGRPRLA